MKRYLSILIVMLMPFLVGAASCNSDKVAITSIKVLGNNGAEEKSPATFDKLTTNVDVAFKNPGDQITYHIEIKNDSTDIFKIRNDAVNKSDIIEYSYEIEGDALYIKPGEVKGVNLVVTYKNAVPEARFVNNVYAESFTFPLKITNNNEMPKTGLMRLFDYKINLILIILSLVSIIFINKKSSAKYLFILLLLPVAARALCETSFVSNIKVEIVKQKMRFCVLAESPSKEIILPTPTPSDPLILLNFDFVEYNYGDTVQKVMDYYDSILGKPYYLSAWRSNEWYDTSYKDKVKLFLDEVYNETGIKVQTIREFETYFLYEEKYTGTYNYLDAYTKYKLYEMPLLSPDTPLPPPINVTSEAKIVPMEEGCYVFARR